MVEQIFWPTGRTLLTPELQGKTEGKKHQKMGLENLHHKRPSPRGSEKPRNRGDTCISRRVFQPQLRDRGEGSWTGDE